MLERVTVKDTSTIEFAYIDNDGKILKCYITFKKAQRWYLTDIKDGVYYIERENVRLTIKEKDFNNIFEKRMRDSKWE